MAKLLSSLPGYEFDVVTFAAWKKWFGEDNSFETVIDENFGVVECLKVPRVLRWLPLGKFGVLGKLPDTYRFFNFLLFKKAREMINKNNYEVMITWSQPHSSHLVGLKLKTFLKTSPKWVAHFSDPWPSNPFFEVNNWIKMINEDLFTRVLNEADAITVTNEQVIATEEGFSIAKNRGKVHVIPHSFLPSMYPSENKSRASDQIILRYIGSFYGLRRPDPILSALALLEAKDPNIAKQLRLEFIGAKPDEKAIRDIQKLKLVSVEVLPPVSFRESLGLMQNADLLLIIDAPMDTSPFLPSKLIDYIGSNVPVLAFTPPGPSAKVVMELGGWVVSPTETELGYEALKDALGMITAQDFSYSPPLQVVERFKSSENGMLFVKVIRQMTRDTF
jgi:glycosyltransferase involved in cell wall biosynthesis